MNSNDTKNGELKMELIDLTHDGSLASRSCSTGEITNLGNTLLGRLFPDGQVACLNVSSAGEDVLEGLRNGVKWNGRHLVPVGSRNLKHRSKLYLVDEKTQAVLASRFGTCGEAFLSFFDLMLMPCAGFRKEPNLRMKLVAQPMPGRIDWRASIRRSVFEQFSIKQDAEFQFVMSFQGTQASGELNIMEDAYADRMGTDILLPRRSVRPMPYPMPADFVGEVLLGIGKIPANDWTSDHDVYLNRVNEHVCKSGCKATFSGALNYLLAPKLRAAVVTFSGTPLRASMAL